MFLTVSHNSVRVVLYIAYIDDMFFCDVCTEGRLKINACICHLNNADSGI